MENVIEPRERVETLQLEREFGDVLESLDVAMDESEVLISLMAPLRQKNSLTHRHYLHSLRVAVLLGSIGDFLGFGKKALVYAGAMHDVGKAQIPVSTLAKTTDWTPKDFEVMKGHVLQSYRTLHGCFNFIGSVILWHHRFQANGYPLRLPSNSFNYPRKTKDLILKYGRMVALADCYDAMHRKKDRHGIDGLTSDKIKENMLRINPDVSNLIVDLYGAGIFKA